jgi:hypothetical protein
MKNEISGMDVSFFPFAPFLQWKMESSISFSILNFQLSTIEGGWGCVIV